MFGQFRPEHGEDYLIPACSTDHSVVDPQVAVTSAEDAPDDRSGGLAFMFGKDDSRASAPLHERRSSRTLKTVKPRRVSARGAG